MKPEIKFNIILNRLKESTKESVSKEDLLWFVSELLRFSALEEEHFGETTLNFNDFSKFLNTENIHSLLYFIEEMIDLWEERDQEDYFGTEGWRHCIGWDE